MSKTLKRELIRKEHRNGGLWGCAVLLVWFRQDGGEVEQGRVNPHNGHCISEKKEPGSDWLPAPGSERWVRYPDLLRAEEVEGM